ncbi:MAG: AI-2E family transporter [Elusimicrobia bacterium]|nr:AI-2E family transporter [Elusimicrobiota bacterium]
MKPNGPSRAPLIAFLLILSAIGYLVLRMMAPYVLALFLGGTMAALAQPLFRAARRAKLGPRLSAGVVTVGILVLGITPAALFSVQAVHQAASFGQDLAEREDLTLEGLWRYVERVPRVQQFVGDQEALRSQLIGAARRSAGLLSGALGRLAKGIPEFLLQLALTVVALYFFLVDGKGFVDWLLARSALHPDVRKRLLDSLHGTAIATVWASLAAAAAQSLVVFLGFLILGAPTPFLAGGASFILAWIPMVGTAPITLSGVAYFYLQGELGRMIGMLATALIAGLSDNVVRPLVLGGGEGMHPFVALLSILGGIEVFGIFGVFLGPIVVALFISLFDIWPALAQRAGVDVHR